MADRIFNNSFASTEWEWHKKGVKVDHRMITSEALKASKMDFSVVPENLYIHRLTEDGIKHIEVKNYVCNTRADLDLPIGIVTKGYQLLQPIDCFDWFDSIVQNGEACIETAGVLNDSKQIFITAKLPESITVLNNDLIDQYLLLMDSYDGSSSVIVKFTPIRVVCSNTLAMALNNNANTLRFKHTRNVKEKLQMAASLLGIQKKYKVAIEETLLRLCRIKMEEQEVIDMSRSLILNPEEMQLLARNDNYLTDIEEISTRKKNIVNSLTDAIFTAKGQEYHKGTGLWFYNGVTSYLQNVKKYSSSDEKMESILFGAGDKLANTALNKILSYA